MKSQVIALLLLGASQAIKVKGPVATANCPAEMHVDPSCTGPATACCIADDSTDGTAATANCPAEMHVDPSCTGPATACCIANDTTASTTAGGSNHPTCPAGMSWIAGCDSTAVADCCVPDNGTGGG